MIRVSVLYPREPGKKFDFDYYVKQHMPMCQQKMGAAGLLKSEVDKAADENSPFMAAGHLYFKSVEDFQNAFYPHMADFAADMANYTDVAPQLQISEILA